MINAALSRAGAVAEIARLAAGTTMAEAEVDQIALRHKAVEATGANLDIEIAAPHCRNNVNAVQRLPAADAQRLGADVGEHYLGELETKGRMRSIGMRPVVKVLFRARAAN